MTETKIEPALTAEEWRGGSHWTATSLVLSRYVPDSGRGLRENVGGFEIRVNAEGVKNPPGPRALAEFTDEDAHAIAALALHHQPFGFTREDVEELRMAMQLLKWGPTKGLASIIARIEALLPPNE